jgi:hypothetical protein
MSKFTLVQRVENENTHKRQSTKRGAEQVNVAVTPQKFIRKASGPTNLNEVLSGSETNAGKMPRDGLR